MFEKLSHEQQKKIAKNGNQGKQAQKPTSQSSIPKKNSNKSKRIESKTPY